MSAQPPQIPPATAPFETLLNQIKELPLWVKQVLYTSVKEELERTMAKTTLDAFGHEDTLQLLRPQITPLGRREVEVQGVGLSTQLLKFLKLADQERTVIDICMICGWTLEQCAVLILESLEKEFILRPKSGIMLATVDYLAGRTRLGEYLVKIGRVSVEQLDQALRTQRYIEESLGERTGIANVLINLGYIHKQDSEGILFLKEESKKTFSLSSLGIIGGAQQPAIDPAMYNKMRQELMHARERIRQLEMQQSQGQVPRAF